MKERVKPDSLETLNYRIAELATTLEACLQGLIEVIGTL